MYTVDLSRNAAKSYSRLPKNTKKRVAATLNELRHSFTPDMVDVKKLKGRKNVYRARLGAWRILYRVDSSEKLVLIYDILPRKKAY